MNLKFSVGEIWKDRYDCPYIILEIHAEPGFPIIAKDIKTNITCSFTQHGKEISNHFDSPQDLITYVGNKKDFPEYQL